MNEQTRGRNLALAGASLQVVLTAGMLAIGVLTEAKSAVAAAWFLLGGVLVWLMSAVLFYCRQLEQQEETELAELAGRGETGGIFENQRDLSLRPARTRRAFVERWVVPIFTLVLGGYHVALGVLVLLALRFLVAQETLPAMADIGPGLLFAVVMGFPAFLFSRYCTGLSGRAAWRPLRAPASMLLLGAVALAGVVAAFAAAWWGYRVVDIAVAFAVVGIQFVAAIELTVSFILDLYRPRVVGAERRLSYDSRIFGLLAEPARVGHSIAETLNYQFGFEVSGTWFYRLLSKALVPLVIFAVAVLVAMTSIVVVYEGQQCVVLHWGRRDAGRLLGPGIHLKWPWPVDTAEAFDVRRVHELLVGVGETQEPTVIKGRELRLWTEQHGRYRELDFLLAIPPVGAAATTRPAGDERTKEAPPPVNIIKLVMGVHYRLADPYKFAYRFTDGAKLLEGVAYREMVTYCASATLDSKLSGDGPARPEAIMTSGWGAASKALERNIRRAVGPVGPDRPDALDLGVEIVSVKLVSVHPPWQAADAFEAVLAAEREQDRQRFEAEGVANRTLAAVAGEPDAALELALAITRLGQLTESQSELRRSAAEFDRAARGRIRQAADDIKMLLKEIHREGLLGRLPEDLAASAPGGGENPAAALRSRLGLLSEPLRGLVKALLDDEAFARLGPPAASASERLAARHVRRLIELIEVYHRRERFDFAPAVADARLRAEMLLDRAMGSPAQKLAEANAYRLRRQMEERGRADSFRRTLLAYRASPNMYMLDRWLDVWDEVLPGAMKYVLGLPRERVEVWANWERERRALEGVFQQEEPAAATNEE